MPRIPLTPTLMAVLTLAACGMAGAATLRDGAPLARSAPSTTACALHMTQSGGLISLQARAESPHDASGHYGLTVAQRGGGGSAMIDQGGPVVLRAGRPEILSDIAFTGRPQDLRADLTLTVAGRTQDCPLVHDN